MCLLIFGLVLLVYAPALNGGQLWDDDGHLTRPELRSLAGLGRIWFEPGATQQYYPLLHSAFWLQQWLWGDATFGYHLVNILGHAAAACLAGLTLQRLRVRGAWLAAVLFALHPVCVESVAWISEQKNTLSAVLYFCAALAYLRFDADRRGKTYAVATVFFVLALATKTVTASLPAALLVIFWWKRGRVDAKRDVRPLLPWFALGLASGLVTVWVERTMIGAHGGDFVLGPAQRCLLAGRAVWFYLGKLLWPVDLAFVYPRWVIDASSVWQYLFPLGVIVSLAGLLWGARQRRGPLAGALFFIGTLFPALGFVDVYPFIFSFVADHFQYLASLGVFALIAAGGAAALPRWPRATRASLAAVLAALGVLTWRQAQVYRTPLTLYEATLRLNPTAWMAHTNLAGLLLQSGRAEEALPHLEAALKINPNLPEAENNFGSALRRLGRTSEALAHFERAVRLRPGYLEALNNLGLALTDLGRLDEAIAQFEAALRVRPDYSPAHSNLGLALQRGHRLEEAIAQFAQAVHFRPDYATAESNWAACLTNAGRFAEAVPHFERAMQLEPRQPVHSFIYGQALATTGHTEEAIVRYRHALELNPDFADAHYHLALALHQLGREEEAQEHLQAVRRLGH
jgi:tetratricopeptide (TPR) repeat protein